METFFTAPASLHNRHYEKFSDGRVKDIEDEIPFAVPEGWAWCRLGEIGQIISGTSYQKNDIISKGTLRILRGGNIQNNTLILKNDDIFIQNKYIDIRKNVIFGDIIIVASTGSTNSIGKPAFIDKDYASTQIGAFLRIIRMILLPISKYISLIFQSEYYANYIQNNIKGTNINNIKAEHLQRMVLPLPPLAEQKRIVTAIETIFVQIDLLEQNKADLQTAVKQAKSKILDLAIRGKLVKQDPADEPASVMLEKLRAEKEAKIASGEVKRGKNDSYIYRNPTDNCYYEKFIDGTEEQFEIPFDLPENWCWQKISSICEINPKNKLDNTLEVSFVPMTLIDSEFNNRFSYELQRWETVKSGFSHFSDNDIGIAKITPCFENRKSVIFKNLKNKYGAGTTELHILRTNNKYIFNEYVFWFIKTDAFIKEGINNFTGAVGQQRIGKEFIAETLIPIPPLNEQVKICRTINTLIKKLDEISLNTI